MFFDVVDLTLNLGTMLALFVLIGIVVDDALAVGESIATERESGKNGIEAAVSGVRSVAAPVTVGVITTIMAFVPFLFILHVAQQFRHRRAYGPCRLTEDFRHGADDVGRSGLGVVRKQCDGRVVERTEEIKNMLAFAKSFTGQLKNTGLILSPVDLDESTSNIASRRNGPEPAQGHVMLRRQPDWLSVDDQLAQPQRVRP